MKGALISHSWFSTVTILSRKKPEPPREHLWNDVCHKPLPLPFGSEYVHPQHNTYKNQYSAPVKEILIIICFLWRTRLASTILPWCSGWLDSTKGVKENFSWRVLWKTQEKFNFSLEAAAIDQTGLQLDASLWLPGKSCLYQSVLWVRNHLGFFTVPIMKSGICTNRNVCHRRRFSMKFWKCALYSCRISHQGNWSWLSVSPFLDYKKSSKVPRDRETCIWGLGFNENKRETTV